MTISRREFLLAALAPISGAATARAQTPPPLRRDVPWLAEVQRPPASVPPGPPLAPLVVDFQMKPITMLDQWQTHRVALRESWQQFLGTWDAPRGAPAYQIVESDRVGPVTRQLIKYESERNVPVEAYLLVPPRITARRPGVVVFHSTVDYTIRQSAGVEGPREAHWGLRLAEQGIVTLCPRCFLWDADPAPGVEGLVRRVERHQKQHPHTRGMAKMLYDARRAVDVLASLPVVDPRRIGAAGHSLGAKQVLYLAAFDERIAAAVASEGGVGTSFSNWDAPWYLGAKDFGHDHHELLGLVAPRAMLVIGGDSADGARTWPYIQAALDVYALYRQPPPRIGLFNHGRGHTIPPLAEARTYEWLATYL